MVGRKTRDRSPSRQVGTEVHTGVVWVLSFVNGAIVWGFVFGQTYRFLPGNSPWLKGIYFGVCAWLVMGILFFPLVDRGIFAAKLGLGIAPAISDKSVISD